MDEFSIAVFIQRCAFGVNELNSHQQYILSVCEIR
jgi:hypothetical protein